jgi:hypothetical protein
MNDDIFTKETEIHNSTIYSLLYTSLQLSLYTPYTPQTLHTPPTPSNTSSSTLHVAPFFVTGRIKKPTLKAPLHQTEGE